MVEKKKASSKPASAETTVTRIKASEDKPAKVKKQATPVAEAPKVRKKRSPKALLRPAKATGGYFKGAWTELRQVRWPTRRATWSLTFAVIAYSIFFVVIILLLDALFKYLFELMLGK